MHLVPERGTMCRQEVNSITVYANDEYFLLNFSLPFSSAYTVSFPYGQCREWTTHGSKCRAALAGSRSQCEFYKSCSQCRDDPACGWCDDGSKTGLGKCMPGGDSGPQDEMVCPSASWYFTRCPSCQCNGHSMINFCLFFFK